jgi:hypothetical protein
MFPSHDPYEFTNTQLADYRRRHRIDNFYATRRPELNNLNIENMPQGRKRTFIAAPRQSGYQPVARKPPKRRRFIGPVRYAPSIRRPLGGVRPQDLTYVNVFKMVEFLPSTTAAHTSSIPGVIKPSDILGCPKLSRYLNSYSWIKLHKMGLEFLGTHSTFIMSTYDTDTNELKEDEAFFERSINLRLHRNDKNGKAIIGRTQSLHMKAGYTDYCNTTSFKTLVEDGSNQCSIKFLATNLETYPTNHGAKLSALVKFTVSVYGIKDTLPGDGINEGDNNAQMTIVTE